MLYLPAAASGRNDAALTAFPFLPSLARCPARQATPPLRRGLRARARQRNAAGAGWGGAPEDRPAGGRGYANEKPPPPPSGHRAPRASAAPGQSAVLCRDGAMATRPMGAGGGRGLRPAAPRAM